MEHAYMAGLGGVQMVRRMRENRGSHDTWLAGRLGLPFGPDTMYYFVRAFFLNMYAFDACLGTWTSVGSQS